MDITKKCIPCQGGIPKLSAEEIISFLRKIDKEWKVEDDKLIKYFNFSEYEKSLHFANKVAKIAIEEDHHPFIHINFKTVKIIIFTHKISGLHENDFLIAAKIDKI
ncbi:MAG: 4a-hydroxytetrahydrobiopterin dehydratase [Flavobacteriales bacterium]|nr:4a-hydroxytetrahydrobiopterin dehydratase [Flavobacteriales bacterium]|tara:strand:+ start:14939 stop:15256 length:318 start_codon:yes stop_codon:yes gene_type:complete